MNKFRAFLTYEELIFSEHANNEFYYPLNRIYPKKELLMISVSLWSVMGTSEKVTYKNEK